eukprot:1161777-Pelagomonas_calceolata.AAC.11
MTRRQLHIRECLNGTCRRRRREIDDDQMMTRRQLPIRECLNGSCRCGAVFCVCTPERPNACIVHIHNTMRAALTTKSSGVLCPLDCPPDCPLAHSRHAQGMRKKNEV